MFNKKELVTELKTAMRAELELKLKATQKEFIDLKFKVNKLNIQIDSNTKGIHKIEDELHEIDGKFDEIELKNVVGPAEKSNPISKK